MPPKDDPNVLTIPPLRGRPAWKVNPVDYVEMGTETINDDMARHSAKMAWIGQNWADAKYAKEVLKDTRDRIEAELIAETFAIAAREGKKAPTGKEVDAIVLQMDPYVKANEAYLEMSRVVDHLDSIRDALNHRIQALIGLGAQLRREYDSRDPGKTVERVRERETEYRERLRRERDEDDSRERERRRR